MDAQEKKLKMSGSVTDTLSRFDALQVLGLSVSADQDAIHAAFRRQVRQAAPALHQGCEQRLRRLIMARDVLIGRRDKRQRRNFCRQPVPVKITRDQAYVGGIVSVRLHALEYGAENVTSLMQVIDLDLIVPSGLDQNDVVHLATRAGDEILCRIDITDSLPTPGAFRQRWAS